MRLEEHPIGLVLAAILGCSSRGATVLPSQSDPAAQRSGAADYWQIRVENRGHRGTLWDFAFSRDVSSASDDPVVRRESARATSDAR